MKSRQKETFNDLKLRGLRLTHLRAELVEFILSQSGHWSIQKMAELVKKKLPKVGIATIYRTVNLLVDAKALTRTYVENGPARFEIAPSHHHDHLSCVHCGYIVEFQNEKIEALQKIVAKEHGFKLLDHRMELYGECRRKSCVGSRKS